MINSVQQIEYLLCSHRMLSIRLVAYTFHYVNFCLALWGIPKHVHSQLIKSHVLSLWLVWTWSSGCIIQVLPIFSDLLLTELFWPCLPLKSIFFLGIHDNSPFNWVIFLTSPQKWFSLKFSNWSLNMGHHIPSLLELLPSNTDGSHIYLSGSDNSLYTTFWHSTYPWHLHLNFSQTNSWRTQALSLCPGSVLLPLFL